MHSHAHVHTHSHASTYYYLLCARVCVGMHSTVSSHLILFFSAPSAPPQNLSGIAESPTEVFFTWQPPPPVHVNGIFLYYDVIIEELETGQVHELSSPDPELRMGLLHPYYNYQCVVAAYTVELGPYTNPTVIRTLETRKYKMKHAVVWDLPVCMVDSYCFSICMYIYKYILYYLLGHVYPVNIASF